MSYEEYYGERDLTDEEQATLNDRIETLERLEKLERCVETIKDLLESKVETKEDLLDLVSEIKFEIKSVK